MGLGSSPCLSWEAFLTLGCLVRRVALSLTTDLDNHGALRFGGIRNLAKHDLQTKPWILEANRGCGGGISVLVVDDEIQHASPKKSSRSFVFGVAWADAFSKQLRFWKIYQFKCLPMEKTVVLLALMLVIIR
jgi:hypothetical protein